MLRIKVGRNIYTRDNSHIGDRLLILESKGPGPSRRKGEKIERGKKTRDFARNSPAWSEEESEKKRGTKCAVCIR